MARGLQFLSRGRQWLSRSVSRAGRSTEPQEPTSEASSHSASTRVANRLLGELEGIAGRVRRASRSSVSSSNRVHPGEEEESRPQPSSGAKDSFSSPVPCWQGGTSSDTLPDFVGTQSDASTKYIPSELPWPSQSSAGTESVSFVDHDTVGSARVLKAQVKAAVGEACKVKEWTGKQYKLVRTLEKADRNQGCVQLMEQIGTGRFAAVKQMPLSWTRSGPSEFNLHYPDSPEQPWFDIGIVQYLKGQEYPFICEFFGAFQDATNSYFAFSYALHGDLFAWCGSLPPLGEEREAVCKPVCKQLITAVRWLHDLGIAHRDLSLENVLLTQDEEGCLQLKVIDFGMASLKRKCKADSDVLGKPTYQAPETHLQGIYDEFLADNFAVGVMCLAMLSYDLPWRSTRSGECEAFDYAASFGLKKFLSKRQAWNCPGKSQLEVLSGPFVKLVQGLLAFNPRHRLHLGEHCFRLDGWRPSAWDMQWLA